MITDVRDEHLYLGVLLHQSLSWSNHFPIQNYCKSITASYIASAYTLLAIVCLVLKYAASVWDPYQQNDVLSLGKVLKAAWWGLSQYPIISKTCHSTIATSCLLKNPPDTTTFTTSSNPVLGLYFPIKDWNSLPVARNS